MFLQSWLGLRKVDQSFLASVRSIDWFAKTGRPAEFDIPLAAQPLYSWSEAMAAGAAEERAQTTLEARNRLSSYLHANHYREFQRWNDITDEVKRSCITPLTSQVWRPFANANNLGETLIHSTQWNVLAAVMEHEYAYCNGHPVFFEHLLEVYRSGHFPCGWAGSWPEGKLLYF
jgi:hypothetical protein